MTITLLAPLLVAVVGVLVYALSANPKLSEIGRLAFFVGLFWLVCVFAGERVRI